PQRQFLTGGASGSVCQDSTRRPICPSTTVRVTPRGPLTRYIDDSSNWPSGVDNARDTSPLRRVSSPGWARMPKSTGGFCDGTAIATICSGPNGGQTLPTQVTKSFPGDRVAFPLCSRDGK